MIYFIIIALIAFVYTLGSRYSIVDADSKPVANMFMSAREKAAHLRSEYWYDLKHLALERSNHCCTHCKSKRRLVLHHLHYCTLGAEGINDVVIICQPCHQRIHDLTGYDRTDLHYLDILQIDGKDNKAS